MGLFKKYVGQTRKPEGFLGKMMIKGMNFGHVKMADWGMDHLKTSLQVRVADERRQVNMALNKRYIIFGIIGCLCFGIGDWLLGYVDPAPIEGNIFLFYPCGA